MPRSNDPDWQTKADGNIGFCRNCGFGIWKPDFPAGICAFCEHAPENVVGIRSKQNGLV